MNNRRTSLFITFLVFTSTLCASLAFVPTNLKATTRFVGGTNPGNYTTIQEAINDSQSGDVVYVYNGTYHEHLIVDKSISLIGEERNTTIIDGDGSGDVVNVTSDWVNITGFTVKNSGPDGGDAGIELYHVQNCKVTNNTVTIDTYGIFLDSSANNTIYNDTASHDRSGIVLFWSFDNTVIGNTLTPDSTNGIFLYSSENNTIANNTSIDNGYGIYFWFAINNTVAGNNISLSTGTGILLFWSYSNVLYHNNFINNSYHAEDNGVNTWDDGYPSGGNYWDNYTGSDQFSGPNQDQPGSDTIGDSALLIDSDSRDRYPLMFPYGMPPPGPPPMLRATLSGRDMENVTLTWSLSSDDGSGYKSVIGYMIYRNASYHPEGLGYGQYTTLPNGTSEFMDVFVGEGDPNNYFYQVCALDVKNQSTCGENQVAKFTRTLALGPNLISIPLIQLDENVETVLQTVSFDRAWSYDGFNQEWKSFIKSKPYHGGLTSVNHTRGLWMNVTRDSNLTVAGVVPSASRIILKAGWNLVGFPSFDENLTVADLKLSIVVERVEEFDALATPYFLRLMLGGDILETGYAYWLNVAAETTWIVRNE